MINRHFDTIWDVLESDTIKNFAAYYAEKISDSVYWQVPEFVTIHKKDMEELLFDANQSEKWYYSFLDWLVEFLASTNQSHWYNRKSINDIIEVFLYLLNTLWKHFCSLNPFKGKFIIDIPEAFFNEAIKYSQRISKIIDAENFGITNKQDDETISFWNSKVIFSEGILYNTLSQDTPILVDNQEVDSIQVFTIGALQYANVSLKSWVNRVIWSDFTTITLGIFIQNHPDTSQKLRYILLKWEKQQYWDIAYDWPWDEVKKMGSNLDFSEWREQVTQKRDRTVVHWEVISKEEEQKNFYNTFTDIINKRFEILWYIQILQKRRLIEAEKDSQENINARERILWKYPLNKDFFEVILVLFNEKEEKLAADTIPFIPNNRVKEQLWKYFEEIEKIDNDIFEKMILFLNNKILDEKEILELLRNIIDDKTNIIKI